MFKQPKDNLTLAKLIEGADIALVVELIGKECEDRARAISDEDGTVYQEERVAYRDAGYHLAVTANKLRQDVSREPERVMEE